MSKRDKLIQKILKGNSDVTPDEAVKILKIFGYKSTPTDGSHITFRKSNHPSVTIVLTQNPLKSYMIDKLKEALKNEGYQDE